MIYRFTITALTALALGVIGCGEEDSGTGPILRPGQIQPVGVVTAENDVSLNPTIHWHRVGDDEDSVAYDFYIGTSSTPSPTHTNLTDTCLAAGPLMPTVNYRWAVRGWINGTATAWSTVYGFGTRSSITYPMAVGHRWEYRWEHRVVGLDLGDQTGYYVAEIPRTDTGWAFNPVYVLQETWYEFDTDTIGGAIAYYTEENDGLYLVGYDGPGTIQPSSGRGSLRFVLDGCEFRSVDDLLQYSSRGGVSALSTEDIVYEDPPKRALYYPIATGYEWFFRENNPWPISKAIHSFEIVEVPAGKFGCFVVDWHVDMNADGINNDNIIFHDYIAEEGLVRRSITIVNVMVLDEHGTVLGYVDITDEYSLVAWELD